MEVGCRRAHGDTILSGLVLVSRQKPKGPPSYRLSIGESLIGLPSLAAASESDKGLENARVNQPHQIPTSDPGNQHFLGVQLTPYSQRNEKTFSVAYSLGPHSQQPS